MKSKNEAKSLLSYLKCKLPNLLLSIRKPSQDISEATCKWIPLPPLNKTWTDDDVYKYFKLSKDEIELIKNTQISGYHDLPTDHKSDEEQENESDEEQENESDEEQENESDEEQESESDEEQESESDEEFKEVLIELYGEVIQKYENEQVLSKIINSLNEQLMIVIVEGTTIEFSYKWNKWLIKQLIKLTKNKTKSEKIIINNCKKHIMNIIDEIEKWN